MMPPNIPLHKDSRHCVALTCEREREHEKMVHQEGLE
jgi:hypothetical protein